MFNILVSARELVQRPDVGYETILVWAHREKIPAIRDGRDRLISNLVAVLKAIRSRVPAAPRPAVAEARPDDLITQVEVREARGPRALDGPVDHPIEARKGVRS